MIIDITSDKLSASEALYGFCGWLTSRDTQTIMGRHHGIVGVVDLIKEFCDTNNLSDPTDGWDGLLTHPKA